MQQKLFNQEEINFEGKIVRPKNGVYRCPFKCGDPRYPAKKWKTLKGFKKHMEVCPQRPSVLKAKQEDEEKRKLEDKQKNVEILKQFPYGIGDKIAYSTYRVTHPTHKQKGNRMVRVRYEEKRHYYSGELTISNLQVIRRKVQINNFIWASEICDTIENAKKEAIRKQQEYDTACDFASMCG